MKKICFFILLLSVIPELKAQSYLRFEQGKNGLELFSISVANGTNDENGKVTFKKPKPVKKETKVVNGIKIVEFDNLNCIFEHVKCDNYSGIQAFPSFSGALFEPLNISGTLSLPEVVKLYGADTDLGYFSKTQIEKLVLSPCITYIGRGAFWSCKNLREVVFPEGCGNVQIDETAFNNCKNLKLVRVPKGRIEYFAKMLKLPESIFEDGGATLDYNITVEKPSTILDKLPADKLSQIGKLTVTGILDENDLAIIKNCKNLKELDLSHAYTTLSQAAQEQRNSRQWVKWLMNNTKMAKSELLTIFKFN